MKSWFLAAAAASLLAAPALARPQIGQPAPAFTAADSRGKMHSLADYRGKTVVLEWNNPDCPYVKKHYGAGNMQALQTTSRSDGVVWLTVNSGAPGKEGHVDGRGAERYIAQVKAAPSAYLLDPDGKIGRSYGARTTPHMFVIDPKGTLVYMGGIDDKSSADPASIKTATNYVRAALDDLKAGKAVRTATTQPYGCSVKYAG